MEIKQFIPDGQYFDVLIAKSVNPSIKLDSSDIAFIKGCNEVTVFELTKDSPSEDTDAFVDNFLMEVKNRVDGESPDHVLLYIGAESAQLPMDTMMSINAFCEIFPKKSEVRYGLYQNEGNNPLHIVIAIGKG